MVDNMFESILGPLLGAYDVLFSPLLNFGSPIQGAMLSVFTLALMFSIGLALLYKLLMDTEEFNRLKQKMKDLQNKSKEAQKEGKQDEAMKLMKKSTKHQMEFMKTQLKPMMATLVLAFLLFPWLGHTFGKAYDLNQENGVYKGKFTYRELEAPIEVQNSNSTVINIGGNEVKEVGDYINVEGGNWQVKGLNINEEEGTGRLDMSLVFIPLPVSIPFIGESFEAVGFYIIILFPLSTLFRKLMGVQ